MQGQPLGYPREGQAERNEERRPWAVCASRAEFTLSTTVELRLTDSLRGCTYVDPPWAYESQDLDRVPSAPLRGQDTVNRLIQVLLPGYMLV